MYPRRSAVLKIELKVPQILAKPSENGSEHKQVSAILELFHHSASHDGGVGLTTLPMLAGEVLTGKTCWNSMLYLKLPWCL